MKVQKGKQSQRSKLNPKGPFAQLYAGRFGNLHEMNHSVEKLSILQKV